MDKIKKLSTKELINKQKILIKYLKLVTNEINNRKKINKSSDLFSSNNNKYDFKFEKCTVKEIKQIFKKYEIKFKSTLKKKELLQLARKHNLVSAIKKLHSKNN